MGSAVSVIIPTYNRARLVSRAVKSALAAVAPGDEVIVVDDASTDDTQEALGSFGERIRYFRTDTNAGAGAARNRGIREARCPLIAFLDSDDEWSHDRLALGRAVLDAHPEVVLACSDFSVKDSLGVVEPGFLARWHAGRRPWEEILGPGVAFSSIAPLPPGRADFRVRFGDLFTAMAGAPFVLTSTSLVRHGLARDALCFPGDVRVLEDWECFGRLARTGPVALLACETACQHRHSGPRLSRADEHDYVTARIAMLERVWAQDERYVAAHGTVLEALLRDLQLRRVRALLRRGRALDAREALRRARGAPFSHRALAALPGFIAQGVLAVREATKEFAGAANRRA